MSGPQSRFVFVVSTSGSVMNQVLTIPTVRSATHSVIADRPCPAVDKARAHGIPVIVFDEGSNEAFSVRLSDYLIRHSIDYILSFYTQFYADTLRTMFRDRIINFHPSLLPAFKGMDGFGDGVAYRAKILGTTVELIKDVMDEGKIVMQTCCPVDPGLSREQLRHHIFVQQCKTLVQVVHWIRENRLQVNGDHVTVRDAAWHDLAYAPALEASEAIDLSIPFPERCVEPG
ncbi:phosphoribosylglycinamide formyltransferase [Billgrantia lactosivorans]|uniref:phosphoribosylglycinamide formyltransferase n=1 Tax=Billgrantia lactosivorans TaxID=2185141 RepID=UPI000DAD4D82|nr:formyltransferase family protein [Halomonas lactosivorans]